MTEGAARGRAPLSDRSSEEVRAAHLPALDGLRGLAILAVIPYNCGLSSADGLVRIFTFATGAGWIGVQLFFVLSGFLITLNLLRSLGSTNYYRAFYGRRTVRIFPLYYATLALLLWALPSAGFPVITRTENQLWLWLYVSNWTDPIGLDTPGLGHFWSLAIEEQFYLVWPFLIALAAPRLVRLCVGLALFALASRAILLASGGTAEMAYHFTFCRMDALVCGAAAAALLFHGDARLLKWSPHRLGRAGVGLIVAGALVTSVYRRTGVGSLTIGFSVLSVSFAMIVLAAATAGASGWLRILESRPLRLTGKYSYAMYVFHVPIIGELQSMPAELLGWTGRLYPVAYVTVVVALSFGLAALSYHLFEKHFLKLKRFFAPQVRARGTTACPTS